MQVGLGCGRGRTSTRRGCGGGSRGWDRRLLAACRWHARLLLLLLLESLQVLQRLLLPECLLLLLMLLVLLLLLLVLLHSGYLGLLLLLLLLLLQREQLCLLLRSRLLLGKQGAEERVMGEAWGRPIRGCPTKAWLLGPELL